MSILGPTSEACWAGRFEITTPSYIKEYTETSYEGVELPTGILSNGYNIGMWEAGKLYAVDPYDLRGHKKSLSTMIGQVTNYGWKTR